MSTAIVLAGPAREPWSLETRQLYCQMLILEWEANADLKYEDCLTDSTEKRTFGSLIFQGVPLEQAREQAVSAATESVRDYKRAHSPGRPERKRRQAFREAVTACNGALAVTTGLVQTCIVCGGPLRPRSDSAYCSNACRQAAYRKRRNGQCQQKPIAAIQLARERQEMQRAAREAGLSRSQISEFIRVANLPGGGVRGTLGIPAATLDD